MTKTLCRVGLLSAAMLASAGCNSWWGHTDAKAPDENKVQTTAVAPGDANSKTMAPTMHKMAVANIGPGKAATTQPTNNHVTGKVVFTDLGGKLLIVADLSGLAPNTKHGFHIHEFRDLSKPDLSSAGNHFDPDATNKHGDPKMAGMANMIHAGDMGNLMSDDKGNAHLELTVTDLTIDGEKNGVIGHSVIIHAKPDDYVTQPTGASGGRIAGGPIESVTTP